MQRGLASSLWVFLGLLAASSASSASVLRALALEELCQRADRIVLGRVDKLESRWTPDKTAIFTEVTITVERSYKGGVGPGETMIVRKEGGSVAGIGMRVFGAADFRVGEEAILFTEPRGKARFVSGMTQGKLSLLRTDEGEDLVSSDAGGATLLGKPDSRLLRAQPLADFERQLVKIVDQIGRQR